MFFSSRLRTGAGGTLAINCPPLKMDVTMTAPKHLSPATRAWFTSVVTTYELEPHHLRLLQLAGESWDRCQEARELIARDGIVSLTSGRAHPAIAIERNSRLAFARLIRELDLDHEPPAPWSRPPSLRSNRRLRVLDD